MGDEAKVGYRPPLQWKEMDPQRRRATQIGMWAWVWQRISAIAILLFLCLHIFLAYIPLIQLLLLVSVVFHAALGIRVILLDFNLVNIKYQKALVFYLLGIGVILLILIWNFIY